MAGNRASISVPDVQSTTGLGAGCRSMLHQAAPSHLAQLKLADTTTARCACSHPSRNCKARLCRVLAPIWTLCSKACYPVILIGLGKRLCAPQ